MEVGGSLLTRTLLGRLALPDGIVERGWIEVAGGLISGVGVGEPRAAREVVDLGTALIAPGFIDLHVHGGGGFVVGGDDPAEVSAEIEGMARFHARHGTTALVATTVTESRPRLLVTAAGTALVRRHQMDLRAPDSSAGIDPPGGAVDPLGGAAEVLGLHLEGPWLARERAGAQAVEHLRLPDIAELEAVNEAAEGAVRIVTVAPELDGALPLLRHAVRSGIVGSIGHTAATYETCQAALDAGARHLTHAGNAMPGIDRRSPGPLAAALLDQRVTLEVIADGLHLHPGMLELLARAAGDRLVLVTDAIAAAGSPDGSYRLGGLDVTVVGGRAGLAAHPETLAGSTLTMDGAVRTLLRSGVDLAGALRAASLSPARVVGLADRKGVLSPGFDADLVILDAALAVQATVRGGQVVHDAVGVLDSTSSSGKPRGGDTTPRGG